MIGRVRVKHVCRSWTRVTYRTTRQHEPSREGSRTPFPESQAKAATRRLVGSDPRVTDSTVLNENSRPIISSDETPFLFLVNARATALSLDVRRSSSLRVAFFDRPRRLVQKLVGVAATRNAQSENSHFRPKLRNFLFRLVACLIGRVGHPV